MTLHMKNYTITRGRAQRPSGSAVVEYRYAEAAAAAVDALEGTELDGRDLRVRAYFSNRMRLLDRPKIIVVQV